MPWDILEQRGSPDTGLDLSSAVQRKHYSGRYAAVHCHGNLHRSLDGQCEFDGHLDGGAGVSSDYKFERHGDRSKHGLNDCHCVAKRDERECVPYRNDDR